MLSWARWLPQRKKRKTIKDSLRRPHLSAEDLGEHSSSHPVTVKCLLRVLLSHSTALVFYYFLLLGPRFKGNSKGRNETVLISLRIQTTWLPFQSNFFLSFKILIVLLLYLVTGFWLAFMSQLVHSYSHTDKKKWTHLRQKCQDFIKKSSEARW